MNPAIKNTKTFRLIALAMASVFLAGCGGGGDDSDLSTCKNPLLLIVCAITQPSSVTADTAPVSGSDSSPAAFAGPVTTSGISASVSKFDAFEPNNAFDNANIVSFPYASDGVFIGGSFADSADGSDTFIFTPNRSGLHSIYVCADTCASAAEDERLSIMLLDQTQTTVDSTVAGGGSLEVAANLTAGMAYYVQVQNYDRAEGGRDYSLVIVE